MQGTQFSNLDNLREQLNLRCLMWRSLNEWQEKTDSWIQEKFSNINAKDIQAKADQFSKICLRVEKNLPANPVSHKLKTMVDTFKAAMPVVTALRNDNLRESHWAEIEVLLGPDTKRIQTNDEDFTLESLIKMNAQQFQEDIQAISAKATAENSLRNQLTIVEDIWKKVEFKYKVHKESSRDTSYILEDVDDIYTSLDETLGSVNMILGSRYVAPLRERAEKMKRQLVLLQKVLDNWIFLQKQWMYLENIFPPGGDIRKQLAAEA